MHGHSPWAIGLGCQLRNCETAKPGNLFCVPVSCAQARVAPPMSSNLMNRTVKRE